MTEAQRFANFANNTRAQSDRPEDDSSDVIGEAELIFRRL
jgi:hypothetical protein